MKRAVLLLLVLCMIIFSTACGVTDLVDSLWEEEESGDWQDDFDADVEEEYPEESAPATYQQDIDSGAAACVVNVEPFTFDVDDLPNVDVSDWLSDEIEVLPIVSYDVVQGKITNPAYETDIPSELDEIQGNHLLHQQIWNFFSTLIPYENRIYLVEFQVMTDGEEEILASVYQSDADPAEWVMEVDVIDIADTYEFFATLVHEYAHLLSLNPSQVQPSVAIFYAPEDDDVYYAEMDACSYYFPGEGCSYEDSYINLFVDKFWDNLWDEWSDIDCIEDEDDYYDALDTFYYKYEDQFVSDYAATNPEEDFAETFSAFVLDPQPSGDTIAEEKILFMYDFPELVNLRSVIISQLCSMVD